MAEMQSMVESILSVLDGSSLDASFVEMVIHRLESFGYIVTETDVFAVSFAISKSENHYKNSCNITEIPDGLIHNLCDTCCGEFLKAKYATGTLDTDKIQRALTSIRMGDTQLSFGSKGIDFESMLEDLISGKEGDLVCYRTIKW